MALILADRVKSNTTTTGTGTVVLNATAPTGYQSFAVIGDGNTTYYTIAGQTTSEWEVGIGTYFLANSSLSRTTILSSSNANAAVTFSSGTKDVFVTYPAEKSVGSQTGYFDSNFQGTFVDGVVVDYDPIGGAGRFSVGTGDKFSFYNNGVSGNLLGSISTNGDWAITRFLSVGNGTLIGGATNPVIAAAASANNYVQSYIHNDQAGVSSSADIACYPDNGVDASGWIDMGITSSAYADAAYPITVANEGYIFMSAPSGAGKSGNLIYATDSTGSSNAHQWYVGGFGQAKSAYKMQLNGTNLTLALPLNSTVTTGTAPFTVNSTTQVANLSAATAGTAANVTGTIAVANGGTGIANLTAGSLVSGNNTSQVVLIAPGTTGNVLTSSGTAWVSSSAPSFTGGTLTSNLTLAAGTATAGTSPLRFQSGTNLTTAAAGAVEYDGTVFYSSTAASTRGIMPSDQWVSLSAPYTLTSQVGAQKIFNSTTNGAVTLAAGTYKFECGLSLTNLSTTSGSFGFALGGTVTIGSQAWNATTAKPTSLATGTPQPTFSFSTANNASLIPNNVNALATTYITGMLRISTTGTLIPSITLSTANAATVGTNSYFRITSIGANTVSSVGNWS